MEEKKGTYNEDGEYVMTDEEAEKEYSILEPLLDKYENDIDGIFYVDEINEHIKKLIPYYKARGIEIELLEYDSEVRKQLEREVIIAKERRERDEAWLKMTDEERIKDYEKTVEEATKFAEKIGMNIYELKDKDE